jgi:hypothetical protein
MTTNAFDQIKGDKTFEADVNKAVTFDDIRELAHRAAERSGLIRRDESGRFVSTQPQQETRQDSGEQTYSRVVEIAGVQMEFVANTPDELEFQINTAKQTAEALYAQQHPVQQTAEPTEPTAEEIESERVRRAAEQANLQLRFQRGEVSAAEYIAQSGAVDEYLAERGIDINELREESQKRNTAALVQSWADATQQFLATSDWVGGEKNKNTLHTVMAAMDLLESADKVDALRKGWAYMRSQGMVFPNEDVATQEQILKTAATMEPAELLQIWKESQKGAAIGDAAAANQNLIELFRRK